MCKKVLSVFLAAVFMMASMSMASFVLAESEEDIINSIPIVEYQSTPLKSGEGTDYDSAKIISVAKKELVTENETEIRKLINENRVIFFKNTSVGEVGEFFKIPGFISEDDNSYVLLGTAITMFEGVYHYIECLANNAELSIDDEPDYDYDPEEDDTDTSIVKFVIDESDYDYFARYAYASAKIFEQSETKGGFPTGYSKILTSSVMVYKKSKAIAILENTTYFYDRGIGNVNGNNCRIYDYVSTCFCSPKTGSKSKVKTFDYTMGHKRFYYGGIFDATRIASQETASSVEVGLSPSVDLEGNVTVQGGITVGWSYSSDAFDATNRFGENREKSWKIKPKKPKKEDSWNIRPGIRTYVTGGHDKPDYFITLVCKFRTGFLSSATGKLNRACLSNKY